MSSLVRHAVVVVVVVVVLLLVGCGDDDLAERGRSPASTARATGDTARTPGSASGDARIPALCRRLRARVTGRLAMRAATELSGLAVSRTQERVLWTHNDSDHRAEVFAVAPGGRLLADVTVTGAQNVDWEDIAVGPSPGPGDALYIGDIGDNDEERPTVVVYRVAEPRVADGRPNETAPAESLVLRYPDGARDAEALLVDPSGGALVIVTKDYGGHSELYVAVRPSPDATTTLRRAGSVAFGVGGATTAGDVSSNGRTIVVRTYSRAFVWQRQPGTSLTTAMRRRPCVAQADLSVEGQGEALALTAGGRAFYTVPEGDRPALRLYAPSGG